MKITYSERLELIRLVEEEGKNMTNAAKEMNLRPSTARAIIKTYESTGKVFETRKEQ